VIAFKTRRIPQGLEDNVNQTIDEMLKAGVIRPSESPWNFPIVEEQKKDGAIRLCVDYRALNAKTTRPIFPIPSTNELFDTVGNADYFTVLDLNSGYHQVPVRDVDIEKTAFSTRYGQFKFTRMPLGLRAAPATL